jgi:hypothetical protein
MKPAEIKSEVKRLMSSGISKIEIFKMLSAQGAKESKAAYAIASYADPELCKNNSWKINTLVAIQLFQAVFVFFILFNIFSSEGGVAKWIAGGLGSTFVLLFAWGFYKSRIWAYNVTIVLSITQLPNSLKGFQSNPISSSVALAIGVALVVFVWHVRSKLFPDFGTMLTPRKAEGKYVFTT